MKIEVGKHYRTRDGRKVKIVGDDKHHTYPFDADNGNSYTVRGTVWTDVEVPYDLVAEWPTTSPVRTVTRKEIVPGVYGLVDVGTFRGETHIRMFSTADPAELRAAIATLTEIADALEDNQ